MNPIIVRKESSVQYEFLLSHVIEKTKCSREDGMNYLDNNFFNQFNQIAVDTDSGEVIAAVDLNGNLMVIEISTIVEKHLNKKK